MVWYAPKELALSLGITLPFFLYYAWRLYSLILDHMAALRFFGREQGAVLMVEEAVASALPAGPDVTGGELMLQLGLSSLFTEYERRIGGTRRAIRADIYTVILIGFFGTLFGMAGSFTLIGQQIHAGLSDPAGLIQGLVNGGMATALVSSLVAAVMGGAAMAYLSFTERAVVEARLRLSRLALEALRRHLGDGHG